LIWKLDAGMPQEGIATVMVLLEVAALWISRSQLEVELSSVVFIMKLRFK